MLKKLLFLTLAMCALSACDKDEKPAKPLATPPEGYVYANSNSAIEGSKLLSEMRFFGESVVTTIESGDVYANDNAQFELRPEAKKIYLYMLQTRFAPNMPAIEMRLTTNHIIDWGSLSMSSLSLTPQNYVPAAEQWVDNSRFLITDYKCRAEGLFCIVSFTCAEKYKVTFSGRLIVKAN